MKFRTKHKELEENLFADMIVLAGAFMEYGNMYSDFTGDEFLKYYNEQTVNICTRCRIQNYVIKQAKRYYKQLENINITYSKVKRIFRRNTFCNYRIRREQYFFWKFVMDYIISNKTLFDIFLKEVLVQCNFHDDIEQDNNAYIGCMQRMLGWYYVRIAMNNRIFCFEKGLRKEMLSMFYSYEQFPTYKQNCVIYMINH